MASSSRNKIIAQVYLDRNAYTATINYGTNYQRPSTDDV